MKKQKPLVRIGSSVQAGAYTGIVERIDNGIVWILFEDGNVRSFTFGFIERSLGL